MKQKRKITLSVILMAFILGTGVLIFFFYSMRNRTTNTETPQAENIISSSPTPTIATLPDEATPKKPTATPKPTLTTSKYPLHQNIKATMFWVGEKATEENDYIPNQSSAWDSHWLESFGGVDNPYSRDGFYPKSFKPKENPFYFALPYNDLGKSGVKQNATGIPWFQWGLPPYQSQLKNRWIRIFYRNEVCYGQWEDVGPFEEDDFDYVFGDSTPKESRAGIDLSPALRHCLRQATNDFVSWQFMDETDVPEGPWKEIITTSKSNWK